MTPFEIRLEILKLARDILQARQTKPEDMPIAADIIAAAELLNQFVSNKST